jgi:hypothetical protein
MTAKIHYNKLTHTFIITNDNGPQPEVCFEDFYDFMRLANEVFEAAKIEISLSEPK